LPAFDGPEEGVQIREVAVLKTVSKTSSSRPVLRERPATQEHVAGSLLSGKAPWVFAAAMFMGAAQLFLLELMLAKMLLPRFGGAPAVWATCVVFFQTVLLAGYAYAHLLTTRLRGRRQVVLHLALLVVCLAFLPIGIPHSGVSGPHTPVWPASADQPAIALLGILALTAGLPFLMVSSTTPLLQRWFAASGYVDSQDPYYYYAASNAGSLLALFAYPVLVEPIFSLPVQSGMWAVGFCLWLLLLAVCARKVWRLDAGHPEIRRSKSQIPRTKSEEPNSRNQIPETQKELEFGIWSLVLGIWHLGFGNSSEVSPWTKARWVVLAFVPSSLMLGCTSYLSADVASVPLLWIGPLALYLLSFIFAFARATPAWVHRAMVLALPVALGLQLASEGTIHLGTIVATHLTTLFVAAMVCHGELARSRPPARWLTEYYMWIAVGGALGSCFNALIAPLLFSWVVEYPLALSLAAFLLPPLFPGTRRPRLRFANRAVPIALGCVVGALFLSNRHRFVQDGRVVHEERTFFGVYRIVRDSEEKTFVLLHGQIWQGMQIESDDRWLRRVPLLYYFPSSPIGQVFFAFHGPQGKARTAVVGLGIGSLAGYADSGQEFTFYEIDPSVARIARDPRYFTFLADAEARGADVRVVLGDARLSLQRDQDRRYGMIVLDAFSGDAIPAHLLTKEAFQLYQDRLEEDGLLALHITNDHVDLEPIVAELAWDQKLVALIQTDTELSLEERRRGKAPSTWVVLARQREHFGPLSDSMRWRPLERRPSPILWRDDYTNLLPILRWH
jgi:hypothetical protein